MKGREEKREYGREKDRAKARERKREKLSHICGIREGMCMFDFLPSRDSERARVCARGKERKKERERT